MKKKFMVITIMLSLFMTFFTPFEITTNASFYDIFSITEVGDGYSIIGCNRSAQGKIVIPSSIYQTPVTEIGGSAFRDCKGITEIVIPNTVKKIGMWAFMNCENLTKVTFPDSLNEVSFAMFDGTPIKNNPANFYNNAFYYNSCLLETKENISSVFNVKEGTKLIAENAFKNRTGLREINFPQSLKGIGANAFYGCTSINNVTIPENVKIIDSFAFNGCSNLNNITLPHNLAEIGKNVFSDTPFYNNSNNWNNGILYIDNYLIDIKSSYNGDCNIRPGTKIIARAAFSQKSGIKNVTVPSSVKEIPDECFYCCGITGISLPFGLEKIEMCAFEECYNLTTIKIPETVKDICDSAFRSCSALETINIPPLVEEIKPMVLGFCSSLTTIYLSRHLFYIDEGTFGTCDNLQHVYFDGFMEDYPSIHPDGNDILDMAAWHFASIKYDLDYNKTEATVSAIDKEKFGKIGIPEYFKEFKVTKIGEEAVTDCKDLTEITIPKTVTDIAYGAFANSSKLSKINISSENPSYKAENGIIYNKEGSKVHSAPVTGEQVIIPDKVTEISPYAFKNCTILREITLPFELKKVSQGAFFGCSNIKTVKYKGFEADKENMIIEGENEPLLNGKWEFAFYKFSIENGSATLVGCRTDASGIAEVPSLYKGNPVTKIADNAFKNCVSVTEVTLPDSINKIGANVFENCTNLSKFTLPKDITIISDGMFKNCTSIENFEVPNNVTAIGNNAFNGCSGLLIVKLPYTLTKIGDSAFNGCSGLTVVDYKGLDSERENIEIGSLNAELSDATWKYAKNIRYEIVNNEATILKVSANKKGLYEIPNVIENYPVTKIGNEAFKDCKYITDIIIPNTVKVIGENAFSNCLGLSEIEIPEGVTTIEAFGFSNCNNIKTVSLPETLKTVGANAFLNLNISTVYYSGKAEDKNNINIDINNDFLNNARWIYETLPLKVNILSYNYENNNMTLDLNVKNPIDNAVIYGGLYVDKVLVGIKSFIINKDTFNAKILIPAAIDKNTNYTLKIMVWNNNLNPLTFVNEKQGTI